MKSCQKLNAILQTRYDLDLMVEPISREHIMSVFEHYNEQLNMARAGRLMESTDYSKAYLISEAARMILREIAPKRKKKKGA